MFKFILLLDRLNDMAWSGHMLREVIASAERWLILTSSWLNALDSYITLHYNHLADALIQSDVHRSA